MRVSKQVFLAMAIGMLSASGAFAENESESGVMTEARVSDLNRHPERFAGQSVMVTGNVARIEKPGSFILSGSGLINNKILVIVAGNPPGTTTGQQSGTAAPVIREGEKLQLVGKVQELGITKVEERYGPMKAEVKAEFEGTMPILVVPPTQVKSLS